MNGLVSCLPDCPDTLAYIIIQYDIVTMAICIIGAVKIYDHILILDMLDGGYLIFKSFRVIIFHAEVTGNHITKYIKSGDYSDAMSLGMANGWISFRI
jgi:hypothetical protein